MVDYLTLSDRQVLDLALEMGRAAVGGRPIRAALRDIAGHVCHTLRADAVLIALCHPGDPSPPGLDGSLEAVDGTDIETFLGDKVDIAGPVGFYSLLNEPGSVDVKEPAGCGRLLSGRRFFVLPLATEGVSSGVLYFALGNGYDNPPPPEPLAKLTALVALAAQTAQQLAAGYGGTRTGQALYETTNQILGHLDVDEVLEAIATRAKGLLGTDVAYMGIRTELDVLEQVVSLGIRSEAFKQIRTRVGQGFSGLIARELRPLYTCDYLADPRFDHQLDHKVAAEGLVSLIGAPMQVGGRLLGVLMAGNRHRTEFSEEDAVLMGNLANTAAIALENARLFASEREKAEALLQSKILIEAQHARLKRSLDIHDQLTQLVLNDRGMDAITATLEQLVGNPVLIIDRFSRILSWSWVSAARPEAAEAFLSAMRLPPYVARLPQLAEPLRRMAVDKKPFETGPIVELGIEAPIMVAPIVLGGEVVAWALVVQASQKLAEQDRVAVEHGATILALEMAKRRVAAETEARLRGDLVSELLADGPIDDQELVESAALLGYDLMLPHYVIVADLDSHQPTTRTRIDGWQLTRTKPRLFDTVQRALADRAQQVLTAVRGNSLVIFIGADLDAERLSGDHRWQVAESLRRDLVSAFPDRQVVVGISGQCRNPAQLRRGYEHARKAVDIAKSSGLNNRVVSLERLGLHRLLFKLDDKTELTAFVDEILGRLVDYDRVHQTSLLRTLECFLNNGGSLARTAEALCVHVNTLSYRLQRIREVGGLDLDDAESRFNIQAAIRILRFIRRD